MTNTQIISLQIITLVNAGNTMKDAINKVLGAGTYENIAKDVYDTINAKKSA